MSDDEENKNAKKVGVTRKVVSSLSVTLLAKILEYLDYGDFSDIYQVSMIRENDRIISLKST